MRNVNTIVIEFKTGVTRNRALKILESFGFRRVLNVWKEDSPYLGVSCGDGQVTGFIQEMLKDKDIVDVTVLKKRYKK